MSNSQTNNQLNAITAEGQIINEFERLGFNLHEEQRTLIREKISKIKNYVPRVGILGKTGAGKSSLCNALFGREVAEISDIAACTREPQQILLSLSEKSNGIVLVDVPGVGESVERDVEYSELYKNLIPQLDLVLWVIKGDDRALSIDAKILNECIHQHTKSIPVIFVLNQVDKIEPFREWDIKNIKPSPKQLENIRAKADDIAKIFNIKSNDICAVSADEGFGLVALVENIVKALPNDKKFGFIREANEKNVSNESKRDAEKGILKSIIETLGRQAENLKSIYENNKTAIHAVVGVLWKIFTKKKA